MNNKPLLSLKQFMLRQEVLKLYRQLLRTIKEIPDESYREEMRQWCRSDFKTNMHHSNEMSIKILMKHGEKSLKELRTSLHISK